MLRQTIRDFPQQPDLKLEDSEFKSGYLPHSGDPVDFNLEQVPSAKISELCSVAAP